eukprot:4018213-Heterocapsa_arctica.AAC.1
MATARDAPRPVGGAAGAKSRPARGAQAFVISLGMYELNGDKQIWLSGRALAIAIRCATKR